jgi:hypothetical protein
MAQPLQNLAISAPAFAGLNTQDSPVAMNAAFADVAENCVIDQRGRIGARKGWSAITTNGVAALGTSAGIEHIQEFIAYDGTITVFSMGDCKIFTGTTILTEIPLPVGYVCTANNWKTASFQNNVYFFQANHAPLKYVAGATALVLIPDSGSVSPPQGDELLAGFGRLWITSVANEDYKIYGSALLDGDTWAGSGNSWLTLDLTNVWPQGYDSVVALAEHNGYLVVFGKRSIILYQDVVGAQGGTLSSTTADTIRLYDTIEGVGCIARDSVQSTGTDLLFLSNRGLMSLGRLIQEKALPLNDISKNVRTDFVNAVNNEIAAGNGHTIRSIYSAKHAFYIITLPVSNTVYCFDVRQPLEDGSFRVTTWRGLIPLALTVFANDELIMGLGKIGTEQPALVKYDTYNDGSESYEMKYFSHPQNFGNSTNLKFLKKMNVTVIGGAGETAVLNWGYDYSNNFIKQAVTFGLSSDAYFNESEFNEAEYTGGVLVNEPSINTSGSGVEITVGIETTINGSPFSIQKIDLHALLGRFI